MEIESVIGWRAAASATALVVMLFGSLVGPATGSAQEGDPDVLRARALFEEAEAHYSAGQFALAAQGYQRSHELLRAVGHPNASLVLFNVGRALQELGGRDAEAREAYSEFLAQVPVDEETTERIRVAQTHLRELDARLAFSGAHGRETVTDAHESSISPIGPILLSSGGALLVSGLVMVGVAYAQDQELLARCPDRVGCDEALRSDVDANAGLALAGDVFWITGAAVASLGLVLTLVLREGGGERVALQLRGRFAGAYASLSWRLP